MLKNKVSIIIPAYNCEKYIKKCVESLVNQTYKNIEIIIIDDGSTDNTLEILKKYASQNDRIILVSQENRGQLRTRMSGVKLATGDYIMFVDSDDWIDNNTIEEILNENERYDADIIRFTYKHEFIDENRSVLCPSIFKEIEYVQKTEFPQKVYQNFLTGSNMNSMWGQLIKKDIIKEFKFNKEIRIAEDLMFNIYIYTNAKSVLFVPKAYYYYRCNENSISNLRDIQQVKRGISDVIEVYSMYFEYAKIWNMSNKENNNLIAKKILKKMNEKIDCIYTFKNSIKDKKEVFKYAVNRLNEKVNIRKL